MKTCIACGVTKAYSDFYTNGTKLRGECKLCTLVRQRANDYGVTVKYLTDMYNRQAGACAICKNPDLLTNLFVDHNHSCCPRSRNDKKCGSCVRGLLCHGCNAGIGLLRESPEILDSAAKYMLSFRSVLDI